jgi:hypothetical protein
MKLSSREIHVTAINYSSCNRKSSELCQMFEELIYVAYLRNNTYYHLPVCIYEGYSERHICESMCNAFAPIF